MAGSLDELVEFLLGEIALGGGRGKSIFSLLNLRVAPGMLVAEWLYVYVRVDSSRSRPGLVNLLQLITM